MKRDLVQVLFNDRDHLEPPDVTQAGLESNLELLQLLPVQDLLLSQSVQQPVPEKFQINYISVNLGPTSRRIASA